MCFPYFSVFFHIFHYVSLFFIIFHYFSLFFTIFHYFYKTGLNLIFPYFALFFIIFHCFLLLFICLGSCQLLMVMCGLVQSCSIGFSARFQRNNWQGSGKNSLTHCTTNKSFIAKNCLILWWFESWRNIIPLDMIPHSVRLTNFGEIQMCIWYERKNTKPKWKENETQKTNTCENK